jgi:signal transduction histidine kinase
MSTYYYALKASGSYIFDNFPVEAKFLITDYKESQNTIELTIADKKIIARIGRKKNLYGTIYTLTTEIKYINRYKLFKELVEMSVIALEPLSKFQNELIAHQSSQTQEFIHNVTSLNSYSIQDLFALIPQKVLTENINKQSAVVKDILITTPNVAVKTLLKLIKYSLAMKVEFSVFERTLKLYSNPTKMEHSIRAIILSILQIFIEEFEEHKIDVTLDACEKRISVDYDSLFVSLYYLLENSIKYCCPNTTFKIIFKEDQDAFSVLFIMISIKIEDDEIARLSTRGYRSESARLLNTEGNGIGMYRILKTLKFNNAVLEILPRVNNYKKKIEQIEYEGNQFKIKFMGQQDYFKTNWG